MREAEHITVLWNDGYEEEFVTAYGHASTSTASMWYKKVNGGQKIIPLYHVRYIDERPATQEEIDDANVE
jgi:hypothetical protein